MKITKQIRPEEEAAMRDPQSAYEYARNVLHRRFPAGEAAIATKAWCSCLYAINVLHGRFPAGEDTMRSHPYYWKRYEEFLKTQSEPVFPIGHTKNTAALIEVLSEDKDRLRGHLVCIYSMVSDTCFTYDDIIKVRELARRGLEES